MTPLAVAWLALAAAAPEASKPPRLGVLVVVDQFSAGELEALSYEVEPDFAGLIARGAAQFDSWYPYVGTETGPGHATLSTGSTPASHGICANTWYTEGKLGYCVDDPGSPELGAKDGRSARFLMAPTLGDALKSRSPKSKVISVSVKDRAAILLGGPSADLALWYEPSVGRFTSSRAWVDALPTWAEKLAELPKRAFEAGRWSPLPQVAKLGLEDSREGEEGPEGFGVAFPHDLAALPAEKRAKAYRATPSSMEDTLALALAAVDGEQLGKHAQPDLLLVSISATDYSGHFWAPGSVEKVDMLARVSTALKRFIGELDQRLGKNGWAMVLTADHGAAPLAEAMKKARLPGGRLLEAAVIEAATTGLSPEQKKRFQGVSLPVVFLDLRGLSERDRDALVGAVQKNLAAMKGVRKAVRTDGPPTPDDALSRASTYPDRCGPVFVELQPYVVFTETPYPAGTDHASGNVYDRRVPLFVLGPAVVGGRYTVPVDPRDASATLASMLQIPPPDRSEGRPVPAFKH